MTNQEWPTILSEQLNIINDRQQKVDLILEYANESRFMDALQAIELCQLAINLSVDEVFGKST